MSSRPASVCEIDAATEITDETESPAQPTPRLSVKCTTILLCSTATLITAVVSVILSTRSADNALDATDDQCLAALSGLSEQTQSSLDDVATMVTKAKVELQAVSLANLLDSFTLQSEILRRYAESMKHRGFNDTDWPEFEGFLTNMLWATSLRLMPKGLTGIGVVHAEGRRGLFLHEVPETLPNPPDGYHGLYNTQYRDTLIMGSPIPYDGRLDWDQPCCLRCLGKPAAQPPGYITHDGACRVPLSLDPRERTNIALALSPRFPMRQPRWGMIGKAGVMLIVSCLNSWGDEGSSVKRGGVSVGTDLRRVGQLLRESVEDLLLANVTVRVFAVVADDIHYREHLQLPESDRVHTENQTGVLVGVSHGYSYREVPATTICLAGECIDRLVLPATNATDLLIRRTSIGLEGRYHDFVDTGIIHATSDPSGPEVPFYVRTLLVERPGLRWWLVTVIERRYVMEEAERSIVNTLQTVEQQRRKVDDDIETDRVTMLCVLAGVTVVLVAVSAMMAVQMVQPIVLLMAEMGHVSRMEVDRVDLDRRLSHFVEVRSMEKSFREMTSNLKEFRKYVPGSIFEADDSEEEEDIFDRVPPPQGNVTLVFTDIRGSTALWEAAPDAMAEGLALHNKLLRAAIARNNGYEVKTVGDAFFVAFADAADACRFGVEAQAGLVAAEWPQGLAETGLPQAQNVRMESGEWLWNGIRIRIGINVGPCTMELNPMTQRADYFGHPVNVAARIEASSPPGYVGVSAAVFDEVGAATLDRFCVHVPLGQTELRGTKEGVMLYGLLPRGLEARGHQAAADAVAAKPNPPPAPAPESAVKRKPQAAAGQGGVGRLRAALTASRAAVCVVDFALQFFAEDGILQALNNFLFSMNGVLAATEIAAGRTDGLVHCCCGSGVTTVWNCGRRCSNPQEQCFNFGTIVHKRFSEMVSPPRLGLSGGTVLHGNLAGQGNRMYVGVVGQPVEIAGSLTQLAASLGTRALSAGLDNVRAVRERSKALLHWTPEGGAEAVLVAELDMSDDVSAASRWDGSVCLSSMELPEQPRDEAVAAAEAASAEATVHTVAWWLGPMKLPDDLPQQDRRGSFATTVAPLLH